MSKKSTELSAKLLTFVKEYLRDRNGARAAIAAGYAPKSAAVTASRLLRNAKVREKLDEGTAKHLEELDIDSNRVLKGIAQLAFYDPRQLFTEDGKLKNIHDLTDACAMAIKGIDVDTVVNSRRVREIPQAAREAKDTKAETKTTKAETQSVEEKTCEEILEVRTITKKIRLADRGENLERLGRHLKLFTDRFEFEDKTPYDPEREDRRIVELLDQAIRATASEARP